jgi:MerR family transcriptional regulator, copper efflux regulator
MRIGVLARMADVSVDALRLYEARGLIRADRRANGYRDFPDITPDLVRLIRLGQRLGFTLAEIGDVLRGLRGGLPLDEVRGLLEARIATVDRRIADLQSLRQMLSDRLDAACPLILPTGAG